MAWDTDTTKRKLLDAGVRQFAAAGFAGARIETIGADAGVNKERIYRYFGDKRAFFGAVLEHELTALLDQIVFTGTGPDAIAGFMTQLLDRCEERPELSRLLVWESLELDEPVALESRKLGCESKVCGVQSALPDLDQAKAEQLLFSLIALAVGWCELRHLASSILSAPMSLEAQRDTIIEHARALASTS